MNNEPVAWMCQDNVTDEWEFSSMKHCYKCEPLYTHPVKELNDGGEPVKNATYWKRQHDNLLMKLNTCAVKVSELEKKLDTRTRELIGASFYEHDYKTMMANNEPVGLFRKTDWGWEHFLPTSNDHNGIPLYTHPVKELTDEDLDKLIKDAEQDGYMEMYIVGLIDGFNRARAILRKAQEK